jgi:hypothetical protein
VRTVSSDRRFNGGGRVRFSVACWHVRSRCAHHGARTVRRARGPSFRHGAGGDSPAAAAQTTELFWRKTAGRAAAPVVPRVEQVPRSTRSASGTYSLWAAARPRRASLWPRRRLSFRVKWGNALAGPNEFAFSARLWYSGTAVRREEYGDRTFGGMPG